MLISDTVLMRVEQYIEQMRESLAVPGMAVGIVQGSEVPYLCGFGEGMKGCAVTAQTPFIIGSLSKSFTALAIMQLVEAGKLDLDVPIQRYLPWFTLHDRVASARITIRHLLTHTSGISRFAGRALLSGFGEKTRETSVRDLCKTELVHEPGTTFEYSNTNYLIASLVIERVSGKSYEQYIQQHIFEPLSMRHSFTSQDDARAAGLAQGYRWWFGLPVSYDAPCLRDALGAAFLMASVEDMAHWLLLHLDGTVDAVSILSVAGLEELHRPQVPTQKRGSSSAMGWRVEQLGGVRILRHGGEVSNYRSDMVLVPGENLGVIVLANANNGLIALLGLDQIALPVVRILLGQPVRKTTLSMQQVSLMLTLVVTVLLGLQGWSLLSLLQAKQKAVTAGGVVALACDVVGPLLVLWRIPRLADMPWRGLRLYVPDVSHVLLMAVILSLLRALLRVVRWLW